MLSKKNIALVVRRKKNLKSSLRCQLPFFQRDKAWCFSFKFVVSPIPWTQTWILGRERQVQQLKNDAPVFRQASVRCCNQKVALFGQQYKRGWYQDWGRWRQPIHFSPVQALVQRTWQADGQKTCSVRIIGTWPEEEENFKSFSYDTH